METSTSGAKTDTSWGTRMSNPEATQGEDIRRLESKMAELEQRINAINDASANDVDLIATNAQDITHAFKLIAENKKEMQDRSDRSHEPKYNAQALRLQASLLEKRKVSVREYRTNKNLSEYEMSQTIRALRRLLPEVKEVKDPDDGRRKLLVLED